jgi:ferredoxin-NADP reductase
MTITTPAPAALLGDVIRVRVASREFIAEGVLSVTLEPAGPAGLPPWTPGAHVDLHLPGGQVRQYSLCGDPADRLRWRLAVLREPSGRGGSAWIHDVLAAGDELTASTPRNLFPLHDAPRYLFIAGGIGITPLFPMIAQARRRGVPWRLCYAGRRRASMAFLSDLAADRDRVEAWPGDERGRMDLAGLLGPLAGRPEGPGTGVYCCGPAGLLDDAARLAAELGLAEGTVRTERFTAAAGVAGHAGGAFEVELAGSGQLVTVQDGQSVLSALRAAGVNVLSSCEEGTCGTCETGVLEGVPDHRDALLTPVEQEAGDIMMVCVSRSKTPRLVLDL